MKEQEETMYRQDELIVQRDAEILTLRTGELTVLGQPGGGRVFFCRRWGFGSGQRFGGRRPRIDFTQWTLWLRG